jgi:hypothetical protein
MKLSILFRPMTAVLLGILLGATPAFAQVDDEHFELGDGDGTIGSGDILGDPGQAGPDWADIFPSAPFNENPVLWDGQAATFAQDDLAAKGDVDRTIFAGSNKNDDLISVWEWDTGNTPAKDDQATAYVYAKKVGDNLRIYGGVERIASEGDSHVDIEFNQSTIELDKAIPCGDDLSDGVDDAAPCEFIGEREINDIVVSMDFTKGGDLGILSVHVWNGSYFELYTDASLSSEGCNVGNGYPAGTICAFNNLNPIDGGPWPNFGKGGAIVSQIPHNGFTEFGIDVSEVLGGDVSVCYGSVNFKTRSSQSFNSELKDFSLHPFQECNATVTTEVNTVPTSPLGPVANDDPDNRISRTVPVLTVVQDSATVTGVEGIPPTGDVTFYMYESAVLAEDGSCEGTPTQHGASVSLSGTAHMETVLSETFTVPNAGAYGFAAEYSGDNNYPWATSGCEVFRGTQIDSAVNTQVLLGNISGPDVTNEAIDITPCASDACPVVIDMATVTGDLVTGIDPTGDVDFVRYANANCSGDPDGYPETIALIVDGVPDGVATAYSSPVTLDTETFYCWEVIYGGDLIYKVSSSTIGEPICVFEFDPVLE